MGANLSDEFAYIWKVSMSGAGKDLSPDILLHIYFQ